MGIPSYFSWLVRHFEQKIISLSSPYKEVHQFYLDFNCAIHPVARSHAEYTIDKMCDNIIIYLEYLINYVKPTELIYIAVDGVAPVAKMKQQRLRRYKSIKETAETNEIKKLYGKDISTNNKDFNMISPATEFMDILSGKVNAFLTRYASKSTSASIKVIFSDSSIPSEGEHKILQYIKTQPADKNSIIYGLDADLIMLSMCTNRSNISLVRESAMIHGNNNDMAIEKYPQLDYFLVNELRTILFNILVSHDMSVFSKGNTPINANVYTQLEQSQYEVNRVIKDYIFMSFFLGNDFLPPFPTLKIRDNGIETIISHYRQVLRPDYYLCNVDSTINMKFFIELMNILANGEKEALIGQKILRDRRRYPLSTPVNYEEAVEAYQKIDHLSKDHIDVFKDGWEARYYEYFFHLRPENTCQRHSIIDKLCKDYLVALQWNSHYYFDKCADWYWYYHHDATPLLTDLHDYVMRCGTMPGTSDATFTHDQPIEPYYQLMMILPPQSMDLLPLPYRTFMTADDSPLIHYYPVDFELDYYGKRYRWEAHPKIPLMDPSELSQYLDHIKNQLTPEERKRANFL
jgi:5'-3' exonuclease